MNLRDCRITVTGGAGFLGTHVMKRLQACGCENVFVPRSKDYDLRVPAAVMQMYSDSRPDVVIHLAASVGGIGANRTHPGSFLYDNLIMGVEMIEQARLTGVRKFVCVGTICSYPKHASVPFKEDALWDGYPEETNAPYGLAKKLLLVQGQAYRQEYGFNAIHLLMVNLYGPGDNFDLESSHVIPAMIRRFCEARDNGTDHVTLWGDGTPTREFLYVDDAAEAIVSATGQYDQPDPVNVGSGEEISIADLAEKVKEVTGFGGEIRWDASKPNGQPRRQLDVSRARREFGFEARTRFDEGLAKTHEWYKSSEIATVGGR